MFVVPSSWFLAEKEEFSLEDKLLVSIAAAFHDTGFIRQYNKNETIGAEIAERFIQATKYPYTQKHFETIKNAILATDITSNPQTKYEKVLRDADLSYFGSKDERKFLEQIKRLQKESQEYEESAIHQQSLDDNSFLNLNLKFISKHHWFTSSAKKLYSENKQKNIIALKNYYE